MLDSIFSMQAKMFQTMTDIAVTTMNNNIKMANDFVNATTQQAQAPAKKTTTRKAKPKAKAASKKKAVGLPTPFDYFPNLNMSDQEGIEFPFTPEKIAEAWQAKLPQASAWPFPGNFNTDSAFPMPSMNPFSALNPMQTNFAHLMPGNAGQNLKGFMVFFEVPMDGFKTDDMPWNQFAKYWQPNS